jgi:hypothetical protein
VPVVKGLDAWMDEQAQGSFISASALQVEVVGFARSRCQVGEPAHIPRWRGGAHGKRERAAARGPRCEVSGKSAVRGAGREWQRGEWWFRMRDKDQQSTLITAHGNFRDELGPVASN